jgi:2-keto-4-pentenoate hydratase/2-oxohepta-3-ene-1,7-dioic acid hydratase in catechol pathway
VLRKPLLNASPQEALDAIGGFVVVNDWSARDIQRSEMATGLGPQKCKHFCSSMSDEIVDARDVLPRIEQLQASVDINGQTVATTSTANMLHDWARTLSHLSTDEPLWPGELIATGTLPFGTALENGQWLKPGDTLRLCIDGVGEIRHTMRA